MVAPKSESSDGKSRSGGLGLLDSQGHPEVSALPYNPAAGSIEVLPNGNLECDEGFFTRFPASATVKEVTQEPTPQTVWEVDEAGQIAYRAFRIPSLYPGVQW